MSPEVFLQQPYDSSADIWSLGLIFYEIAMMKYAFTTQHKARILNYKLDFYPPQIDYVRRRYDGRVQDLLEMMVQRNPMKRATIQTICNQPVLKTSPIYSTLMLEDRHFK
jgi:serine/threonine protein kinase